MTHPFYEQATTEQDALLGHTIPDFIVEGTNNFEIHFEKLRGYQVIIFFYPQNHLPGVTQLVKDLKAQYNAFKAIKTCIFGVTNEAIAANQTFKDNLDLPFQLIADTDHQLAQWFDTETPANMNTQSKPILEPSSILINEHGKICKTWRAPEIKGHVNELIEAAHKLSQGLHDTSSAEKESNQIDLEDDAPFKTPVIPFTKEQEKLTEDLKDLFEA